MTTIVRLCLVSPVSPGRIQLTRPVKYGEDEGKIINPKDVLFGDPIVGNESVTLTEHGPGALDPRVMTSPKSMSASQRARHWTTHLPYDPSCEVCVRCRRPNVPDHAVQNDTREIPLLVGDYGFIRDSRAQDSVTTLVMNLYPFNIFFACAVAAKGPDPLVVARLAQSIKDCVLTHFAYRSNREPAIMAMIKETCA